ncbi:MAG: DUF3638 domain-containing protein [Proteobacteria bacterium]|nr:DUF3638 domain-containing protein [Pseudomonadota bacterium]
MKRGAETQNGNSSKKTKVDISENSSAIPLDLSIFAHVLNDNDLSGSPLEGSLLIHTVTYLLFVLERMKNEKIIIEGMTKSKQTDFQNAAANMIELLTPLQEICIEVEAAHRSMIYKEDTLDNLLAPMVNAIVTQLLNDGRVFIPGGWRGARSPGHAMLYECRQDGVFLIWNTGSGIDKHLDAKTTQGDVYYTVKAYQIPSQSMLQQNLTSFFKALLTPKVQVGQEYNKNSLYTHLHTQLTYMEAKEIDPNPFVKEKSMGQHSGTCAWAVLASLAINYGFDAFHHEELHYEIMRDTLNLSIQALKLETTTNIAVKRQVAYAIKNFSLQLKSLSDKNELSQIRQQQAIDLIKKIQVMLDNIDDDYSPIKQDFNLLHHTSTKFEFRNANEICKINDQNKKITRNYALAPTMENQSFSDIVSIIQKMTNKDLSTKDLINDLRILQHIIYHLPLDSAFWSKLSFDEICEFIPLFKKLVHAYAERCSTLDNFSFAERTITIYNALALMILLSERIYENTDCLNAVLSATETNGCSLNRLISNLDTLGHNAYFTITSHTYAKKLEQLIQFLNNFNRKSEQSGICAIANLNQTLVSEALSHGVSYAFEKNEIPGAYYLLCRNKEIVRETPIEQTYPKIEKQMQFYMSMLYFSELCRRIVLDYLPTIPKLKIDINWPQFSIEPKIPRITCTAFLTLAFDNTFFVSHGKKSIQNSQIIEDPQLNRDISQRHIPNLIQVSLQANIISSELDLRRRLIHLRSSADSQVVATIQFIQSDLTLLTNADVQQFLFLNLFQNGYLSKELINNPAAIDCLLSCVNKGLTFYTNKKDYTTALYFYKINSFLTQYLIGLPVSATLKQWISAAKQNEMLFLDFEKAIKQLKNDPSLHLLSYYLHLKIIYLSAMIQLDNADHYWLDFYNAQIFHHQMTNEGIDPLVVKETELAQDYLRASAKQIAISNQSISNIFNQLELPIQKISGKFPEYFGDSYTINLIDGYLIRAGNPMVLLPRHLQNHPLIEKLFTKKIIVAQQINENTFAFEYKNESYRLIDKKSKGNDSLVLQRWINLPNLISGWAQWQASDRIALKLSEESLRDCKFEIDFHGLPHTLLDCAHQIWGFENGAIAISTEESQDIKYLYDRNITSNNLYYLDKGQYVSKLKHCDINYAILTRFEDPRYIEIWQDINGINHIKFPRYNLHFYTKSPDNNASIVCDKFPEYELAYSDKPLFDYFNNFLTLKPLATHHLPLKYIVPKQKFIATGLNEAGFYQLSLDIHNAIKARKISNEYQNPVIIHNTPANFKLQDQEKYVTFYAQANATIGTESVEDRFYLAYLYFAKQQPEKAFTILRNLTNVWQGQIDIQELLLSFLENTPDTSVNKDFADKSKRDGSEYIAVRLLVCHLMVCYLQKGLPLQDTNLAHTLQEHTVTLLKDYVARKKIIPKNCRLSKIMIINLIAFVKSLEHGYALNCYEITDVPTLADLKILPTPTLIKICDTTWIYGMNELNEPIFTPINIEKYINKIGFECHKLKSIKSQELPLGLYKAIKQVNGHVSPPFSIILQNYFKLNKIKRREKEFSCLQENRGATLIPTQQDHYQRLLNKLNKEYHIAQSETHLRTKKFNLRAYITSYVQDIATQEVVQSLFIKDLNTETKSIDFNKNLIFLYEEAINSEKNQVWLHHYLDRMIKAKFASMQNATFDFQDIGYFALLKVMLCNIKQTNSFNGDIQKIAVHFCQEICAYELIVKEEFYNQTSLKLKANTTTSTSQNLLAIQQKPTTNQIIIPRNEPKPEFLFTNDELDDPFVKQLIQEANHDYAIGKQKNLKIKEENADLIQALLNNNARKNFIDWLKDSLTDYQASQKNLENKIIAIANHTTPSSQQESLKHAINLYSRNTLIYNINTLIQLFSKYSKAQIARKLNLDINTTNNWHNLMISYLVDSCHALQIQRTLLINQEIENIANNPNHPKKPLITKLVNTIRQKRAYDVEKFPQLLCYEHAENKLIYETQYNVLLSLLEKNQSNIYVSKTSQVIVGGGKSKVITPLLAKLRPTGENLVIIVVTQALFETNFSDLNSVSSRAFDQEAYPFIFHRNLKCDAGYFYQLREKFYSLIHTKGYVVTTRNSLDSLKLKYLLLLNESNEENEEWMQQVDYLGDIDTILYQQADVIEDEVDTNLHPKNQLIYMVTEGKPANKNILKSLIDLYAYAHHIVLTHNQLRINLLEIFKGTTERPLPHIQDQLLENLITKIVYDEFSPIKFILNKIPTNEHAQVLLFLQGKYRDYTNHIPQFAQLTEDETDILALYKEEFNRLMPLVLQKNYNEHFGLSKNKNKEPLEQETAIPYLGNNAPNEVAKYQNQFLAITYTILIHLQENLSEYVFTKFIETFIARYDVENSLNAYRSEKSKHVETEFNLLILNNDVPLAKINPKDKAQLNNLYQQNKNAEALKKYCLLDIILPSILSAPLTIVCDAQDHASTPRSFTGFTGTDYNFRAFHNSIVRDTTYSAGSDGQILDHLVNSNTPVILLQSDHYRAFLDRASTHPNKDDLRVIIDNGSIFTGIINRNVANIFAVIKANSAIRFIVYFEGDTLCAIKTSLQPEKETPIILKSSEGIDKKLGCNAHERLTYYDQVHATGTDIAQAENTLGLVTLNNNTSRDLTQACARLRDLKGTHRVEICVMKSLSKHHAQVSNWNIKQVFNITLRIQAKELKSIHMTSSVQKMHNLFKTDGFSHIRTAQQRSHKVMIAKSFKALFFQTDENRIFNKYAPPIMPHPLKNLLQAQRDQFLKIWQTGLKQGNIVVSADKLQSINTTLLFIINQALPICEQWQNFSGNLQLPDNDLIMECEAHQENEQENEQENQQEKQVENGHRIPSAFRNWDPIIKDWSKWDPKTSKIVCCYSLEWLVQQSYSNRKWQFSPNILVSENFYNTVISMSIHFLSILKKPSIFVLNQLKGNAVVQVLITQEEAAILRQNPLPTNLWIETLNAIPYHQARPTMLNSDYAIQLEQIKFIAAEVNLLVGECENLVWLQDKTAEKLNFLESTILPFHPSKRKLAATLKNLLALHPKQLSVNNLDQTSNSSAINPKYWLPNFKQMSAHYITTIVRSMSTTNIKYDAKSAEKTNDIISRYDNIDAIHRITDINELTALEVGLESKTFVTWLGSFSNSSTYTHQLAYKAGQSLRSNNSVLLDEVKRQKKALMGNLSN